MSQMVQPGNAVYGATKAYLLRVDAALAGWDAGETVTIPSLPDPADWQRLLDARATLQPNLSRDRPAERYLA